MTTQNLIAMKALYLKAKQEYYNTEKSSLTDNEFDILENQLRLAIPKWIALSKTGIAVNKKIKVVLPKFLPSLNKQYPDAINAWTKRQSIKHYIVMDKLDGSSLQLVYVEGKPTRLYTRGDGIVGGDISFLIPHLNIPQIINRKNETIFRCEAIFESSIFKSKWQGSPEDSKFETSRNAVNGLLNRKTPHKALLDVSIVVLGIYDKPMIKALEVAFKLGFETVNYTEHTTVPDFKNLLSKAKLHNRFDIDGLVIADANHVMAFANADKPAFMTAYKENVSLEEAATTTVEEIIWQTSSYGRLIPKARIKPVYIGGVTIQHVTIHNAAWMLSRPLIKATKANPNPVQFAGRKLVLGVGSKIKIVRSGDVIPKIVEVISKGQLSNPKVPFVLKGVHYMELEISKQAELDRIEKFFVRLGIEFIASKTIESCFNAGLTSNIQYMQYWKTGTLIANLERAGIGSVNAAKINAEFTRVFSSGLTVMQFMVASGQFEAGLGERKLQYVIDHYTEHYTEHNDVLKLLLNVRDIKELNKMLVIVPMWSQKTIDLFIRGLTPFRKWLRLAIDYVEIKSVAKIKTVKIAGKLSNQFITFTGYRNLNEEKRLISLGAVIVDFSSKTTVLLYKEGGKMSNKIQIAKTKGIVVSTYSNLYEV